jgi:hypothetical protein
MLHTIVGQTQSNGEIIPHQPIVTENLLIGDIVFVHSEKADIAPQWYRVYQDGKKGKRFFCVTMAFADSVQAYERECWRLEDERENTLNAEPPYMAGHYANGY